MDYRQFMAKLCSYYKQNMFDTILNDKKEVIARNPNILVAEVYKWVEYNIKKESLPQFFDKIIKNFHQTSTVPFPTVISLIDINNIRDYELKKYIPDYKQIEIEKEESKIDEYKDNSFEKMIYDFLHCSASEFKNRYGVDKMQQATNWCSEFLEEEDWIKLELCHYDNNKYNKLVVDKLLKNGKHDFIFQSGIDDSKNIYK